MCYLIDDRKDWLPGHCFMNKRDIVLEPFSKRPTFYFVRGEESANVYTTAMHAENSL